MHGGLGFLSDPGLPLSGPVFVEMASPYPARRAPAPTPQLSLFGQSPAKAGTTLFPRHRSRLLTGRRADQEEDAMPHPRPAAVALASATRAGSGCCFGTTTSVLPGLVGRPRVFAREDLPPLAALTSWVAALERQAGEGASRLRELQTYAGQVEHQLAEVRRPLALRRLVAVALGSWSVWAAKLARDTRVEISSAWRSLEQAAESGLVVEVPGQKRSRGDGTLYAAPPWLRIAGLISVRRGRPAAAAFDAHDGAGLGYAIAELEAAMSAADRLISR